MLSEMVALLANRMIYLLIQLRPVTHRGICDLTRLELKTYNYRVRLFRRVIIIPSPADPIPRLAGT